VERQLGACISSSDTKSLIFPSGETSTSQLSAQVTRCRSIQTNTSKEVVAKVPPVKTLHSPSGRGSGAYASSPVGVMSVADAYPLDFSGVHLKALGAEGPARGTPSGSLGE